MLEVREGLWLGYFLAVLQKCPGRGFSHLGNRNDTANDTAKTWSHGKTTQEVPKKRAGTPRRWN